MVHNVRFIVESICLKKTIKCFKIHEDQQKLNQIQCKLLASNALITKSLKYNSLQCTFQCINKITTSLKITQNYLPSMQSLSTEDSKGTIKSYCCHHKLITHCHTHSKTTNDQMCQTFSNIALKITNQSVQEIN